MIFSSNLKNAKIMSLSILYGPNYNPPWSFKTFQKFQPFRKFRRDYYSITNFLTPFPTFTK